jgi:hypothetical protein
MAFKANAPLDKIQVTEQDVISILKSLDTAKATGTDCISAKMVKETTVSITPSLTRFNPVINRTKQSTSDLETSPCSSFIQKG